MAKKQKDRRVVFILAAVIAIILYFLGVLSGLMANKVVEEKTQEDIGFLVDYVDTLDQDLKSIQLQENFIASLSEDEQCVFEEFYFSELAEELDYYYSIFPSRLEAYEKNRVLSPEYEVLKKDYTRLSLRAWLVSRNTYQGCGSDIVPVLYFYSQECKNCIQQGQVLDQVKTRARANGLNVLVFTIDLHVDEPALGLLEKFYDVTEVPALIINEGTYQGRLFAEEEILEALEVQGS